VWNFLLVGASIGNVNGRTNVPYGLEEEVQALGSS
jgi:hypothetical protein